MKKLLILVSILFATFTFSTFNKVEEQVLVNQTEITTTENQNIINNTQDVEYVSFDASELSLVNDNKVLGDNMLRSDEDGGHIPAWAWIFIVFLGVILAISIYEGIFYFLNTKDNNKIKDNGYDIVETVNKYFDDEEDITGKLIVEQIITKDNEYDLEGLIVFDRDVVMNKSLKILKINGATHEGHVLRSTERPNSYSLTVNDIEKIFDYKDIQLRLRGNFIKLEVVDKSN